jgi:hypothetical protein
MDKRSHCIQHIQKNLEILTYLQKLTPVLVKPIQLQWFKLYLEINPIASQESRGANYCTLNVIEDRIISFLNPHLIYLQMR